ncbi:hypothetical protein [Deinococcus sp. 6GRE01]|uniref:hypothetical protein n=1 Tax=Deinococcus sp. 6GRE01 TaxID=2745873 RepID=UPI001E3F1C40|nr:hypothetical protein [Deinococcus sp. 6GRE01]MCD0156950.1 hypothetical protein [Deinococcus sp. 6GRE01]
MSLLVGVVGPQQDFLALPADGSGTRGQVNLGGEVRDVLGSGVLGSDVLGSGGPAGRAACRLNASLQA